MGMDNAGEGGGGKRMSVWEHISELRQVLIRSLLAVAIGLVAVSIYARTLYEYLLRPLRTMVGEDTLYTHSPPEAFVIYLKIALAGALVLASPIILREILRFVTPGLKPAEKRWILPVLIGGMLLFVLGALFSYFVVVPLALEFLWEFNQDWGMEPLWRAGYYLNFILALFFVFGIAFELPLVVTVLARIGIASPEFLRQQRKYAIVGLVALGAVLTPPDVITQILLALPLWILYEISILMAVLVYPHDHQV
jgi:sec-independent protein translocase protein TatC